MCYNCGCGLPHDNMGHPENITEETFVKAAKAMGQSVAEAKAETYKLLKSQLKKTD